jgi:hypothetical protein
VLCIGLLPPKASDHCLSKTIASIRLLITLKRHHFFFAAIISKRVLCDALSFSAMFADAFFSASSIDIDQCALFAEHTVLCFSNTAPVLAYAVSWASTAGDKKLFFIHKGATFQALRGASIWLTAADALKGLAAVEIAKIIPSDIGFDGLVSTDTQPTTSDLPARIVNAFAVFSVERQAADPCFIAPQEAFSLDLAIHLLTR